VLRDGRDVGVLDKADINERNLLGLMTGDDRGSGHGTLAAPQPRGAERAMKARGLVVWPGAKPFDFDLRRGEIVGVAGLDGQGQDAFVRVLAGVTPAAQGVVQVAGRDGEWSLVRTLREAVRGRISYVSGDRKREGIFASLSIFENMVMPLYREKKRAGILAIIDTPTLAATFKREAENLMIKFGVKEDRITSLSGGNQQKVLIGRGFAMRPDVIVLNDPARGIDVGAKTELYKHLRTFAEEGRAVVYMSSELEEFISFASRVVVFRDGTPFDAFDGRGLKPKQVLEAMFGQTDGSGLTAAHGLRPRLGAGDARGVAENGVRVTVNVPEALRPRTKAAGPAQVSQERLVPVPDAGVRLQPKAIRIVEFDAEGRKTEGLRR
jgi:ribose transport system ATP-binding protein